MYWSGLPGFVGLSHPGPAMRFGRANGSVLPNLSGSGLITTLKGTPLLASKIPPNCQPLSAHWPAANIDLGLGSSHSKFNTRFLPMLKSERARFNLGSNHGRLDTELCKLSPMEP